LFNQAANLRKLQKKKNIQRNFR